MQLRSFPLTPPATPAAATGGYKQMQQRSFPLTPPATPAAATGGYRLMLQRFSPCTPPPNTCRGNGRIQANVIALFPFRSTSYLMPRRRDRGEKQSDLTLPPHRRRLPRRRISLTSRRLSAAGIRKRTDKHALACKKRRRRKRANSCRKRR